MNNLKGHLVLIGVAALGVALILVAILMPPGDVPLPEDQQTQATTQTDRAAQAATPEPGGGDADDASRPRIEPADEPAHVRLFRAASAGDTRTISSLLGMGVNVDTAASAADVESVLAPPLEVGMTALMLAARDSDAATVAALLEAGADPNATTTSGLTPLMLAAPRAQTGSVVALLGAGADPTARTPEGRTALMLAARSGAHEAVGLLVEAGADPDAADADGVTPLMHAAGGQHLDTVIVLLGRGADVTAVDQRGRGALDRADQRGPVAQILREAAGG